MKRKTSIQYYSRGNIGSREFDNERLEKMAERVAKLIEKGIAPEAIAKHERLFGFEIEVADSYVDIVDRNIDAHGNSWGRDVVRINIVTLGDTLLDAFLEDIDDIPDDSSWEITELSVGYGLLDFGMFYDTDYKESQLLLGAEVKGLLRQFARYIEYQADATEDPGFLDGQAGGGQPLDGPAPYAWSYCGWSYKVDKEIVLTASDEDGLHERVCFKRVQVDSN